MSIIKNIHNFFLKKSSPPFPHQRPYLIFGKELKETDTPLFDAVLPWAYEIIPGSKLTISDLIFLWVISRFGSDFNSYPTHLSRNYGITSPIDSVKKLINLQLVNEDFIVTKLGNDTINKHRNYIELHKNGWTTKEEKQYNRESHNQFLKEYSEWLIQTGEHDQGILIKNNLEISKKRDECYQIFIKGEELSKKKKYDDSNKLLLPLLENKYVDFYAPLYERIAKNYRGLKDYKKELDICQAFLKKIQPIYGGDMWINVFTKRIEYANNKMK
ncbi:hypothetical protein [Streptococcus koreensis]|uniref:hypothetical protein n=1 Tax=Streptococcus koreensis TaxID=2382163 RepID=UPI0022E5C913|nr:hypothetical protein [Streptococcus koreensis]